MPKKRGGKKAAASTAVTQQVSMAEGPHGVGSEAHAARPPVTPRPEGEDLTANLDDLEALGDLEQLCDEESTQTKVGVAAATAAGSLPEQDPVASSQSNPLADAASHKVARQTINEFTDRDGDGFLDSEDVSFCWLPLHSSTGRAWLRFAWSRRWRHSDSFRARGHC
jgi:hypothetical protein